MSLALFLACLLQASQPATSMTPASFPDPSTFVRETNAQPIIRPDPKASFTDPILGTSVAWEALHTFNPASIVRNGKLIVLYRAEDKSGSMGVGLHTSRLGMAESEDGLNFKQRAEPVFFPDKDQQKSREWPGGVEDPRIVESPTGEYILTYTQWNRLTYSIGIATSRDLVHWQKHGPAFGAEGRYASLKYKSAGILTEPINGRLIAAKVSHKYWMYWGEGSISLATSTDLIHWHPVLNKAGEPVSLMQARPEVFDSGLPEVGPPPVLTAAGIVMLYNGKNALTGGDPSLDPGAYSAGKAIFSALNPAKLVDRTDKPFLRPSLPWERSGQYAAGTTFIEGLSFFQNRWFLYYGSADSLVGVVSSTSLPVEFR